MDYQRIYNQVIARAKSEKRSRGNGTYYESHHIIPRSEGGKDIKANLVLLTAREHYIAHWLLYRIDPSIHSRVYAFYAMSQQSNDGQQRYTPSSRVYAEAKEAFIEMRTTSEEVTCATCGKQFYYNQSNIKKWKSYYCSMECTRTGEYHMCAGGCGKRLYIKKYQIEKSKTGKFSCSYECDYKVRTQSNNTKECLACGSRFHHHSRKYCNRECYLKHRRQKA